MRHGARLLGRQAGRIITEAGGIEAQHQQVRYAMHFSSIRESMMDRSDERARWMPSNPASDMRRHLSVLQGDYHPEPVEPLAGEDTGVFVIAPSRGPMEGELDKVDAWLREKGIGTAYGLGRIQNVQGYGGTLRDRVSQVFSAFKEAAAYEARAAKKAIIWVLGGDVGSEEVVAELKRGDIDLSKIDGPLIGFSGATPLLIEATQRQWCGACFHGPMIGDASLGFVSKKTAASLEAVLSGQAGELVFAEGLHAHNYRARQQHALVEGQMIGGNLGTIAAGVGNWLDKDAFNGKIVVLEGIMTPDEAERSLAQLVHGGYIDQAKAVVLGQIVLDSKRYGVPDEMHQQRVANFWERTSELFRDKAPLLSGLQVGHKGSSVVLPFGTHTTLALGESPQLVCDTAPLPLHLRAFGPETRDGGWVRVLDEQDMSQGASLGR